MEEFLRKTLHFIKFIGYHWWTLPHRTAWLEKNHKVEIWNIYHAWDKRPAPKKNFLTWKQWWDRYERR